MQPYVFGAILNRSEVLHQIVTAARRAGLPWAVRAASREADSSAAQS